MKSGAWFVAVLILAGAGSENAKGGLILGNLIDGDGSGASLAELTLAVEFQTGPSDQSLGSATFLIRQSAGATVYGGLYAFNPADPSTPGALLTSFATPFLTDADLAPATFTPSRPITLLANTKYWFQLQASPGDFGYGFGSTPIGTGATYLGDYFDDPFFTANSGIPAFELDPLLVPEPSSVTLLGMAFGFALIRTGWRKSRTDRD